MRSFILLDLCLFAILQLATSQECKKADADISGGNLVLNIKNICDCYKPVISDLPPPETSDTGSTCNIKAVGDGEGKLLIRLQDICSVECKRESARSIALFSALVPETPPTNKTISKDSAPEAVLLSTTSVLPANVTTSRPTTIPSEGAINKTVSTTATPSEKLTSPTLSSTNTTLSAPVSVTTELLKDTSASTTTSVPTLSSISSSTLSSIKVKPSTKTTLSAPVSVTTELSTNTSASTIESVPTVSPINTSTPSILNEPSSNTTVSTSALEPKPSEAPPNTTKASTPRPSTHDHTSNETVKKKDPHSDEITSADNKSVDISSGQLLLFFFIGAIVGMVLVLVASYVARKYKARTYEPREPQVTIP